MKYRIREQNELIALESYFKTSISKQNELCCKIIDQLESCKDHTDKSNLILEFNKLS